MDEPLNIVTDTDGTVKDSLGRPMVVIFHSRPNTTRRKGSRTPKKAHNEPVSSGTYEDENREKIFGFIASSGVVKHDKAVQKQIRKHVMHDHRRRQKGRSNVAPGIQFANSNNSLVVSSSQGYSRSFSTQAELSGSLDPFAQYPIKMQPWTYQLVHQYLTVVSHATYPKEENMGEVSSRSGWFALAMSDAALFYTILCATSMYCDLVRGNKGSTEGLLLMSKALHSINQRMKLPGSFISDTTIATVAFLAKAECVLNNYENWKIHMDGLEKLVEIKGGLTELPKWLQDKVRRADLFGSLDLAMKPRFQIINKIQPHNQNLDRCLAEGFTTLKRCFSFNRNLIATLADVQAFTDAKSHAIHSNTIVDSDYADKVVSDIRHRLLSLLSPQLHGSQQYYIEECCRLGALVYLKTIISEFPVLGVTYQVLVTKFESSLEQVNETEPDSLPLLLWMMFVGGMALGNDPKRSYFVNRMPRICVTLRLLEWEEAKAIFTQFWWIEALHRVPFQALWHEVSTTREFLSAWE